MRMNKINAPAALTEPSSPGRLYVGDLLEEQLTESAWSAARSAARVAKQKELSRAVVQARSAICALCQSHLSERSLAIFMNWAHGQIKNRVR